MTTAFLTTRCFASRLLREADHNSDGSRTSRPALEVLRWIGLVADERLAGRDDRDWTLFSEPEHDVDMSQWML
jgi:hypothetical protein